MSTPAEAPTAPTAEEVRGWSRLDFGAEGYPDDDGPLGLQERVVDPSVNWLWYMTARTYGDASTAQYPQVEDIMDLCVRMRSEQQVLQARSDQLETSADIDMIASFSAGLYSETRHAPSRGGTSRPDVRPLNPWPALNDLLWLLLGLFPGETNDAVSDRHDYWLTMMSGIQPPAWATVEVDWGRGMGLWTKGPAGYGLSGQYVLPEGTPPVTWPDATVIDSLP